MDYRVLHAELLGQFDMAHDRAQELEAVLLRTEEEKEAQRAEWDKEKAHFSALIGALRRETNDEVYLVRVQGLPGGEGLVKRCSEGLKKGGGKCLTVLGSRGTDRVSSTSHALVLIIGACCPTLTASGTAVQHRTQHSTLNPELVPPTRRPSRRFPSGTPV